MNLEQLEVLVISTKKNNSNRGQSDRCVYLREASEEIPAQEGWLRSCFTSPSIGLPSAVNRGRQREQVGRSSFFTLDYT